MFQTFGKISDQDDALGRRRSTRALINDRLIRDATVKLILQHGIDALSFREIGKEARLTHGALYARCEDIEELLVDLWVNELKVRAEAMMVLAEEAVANPSDVRIHAVVDYLRNASPDDEATVQVLLASRRFPVLLEETESFTREFIERRVGVPEDLHSRTLLVFSLMMMVVLSISQLGPQYEDLDFIESILCSTLRVEAGDGAPVELRDSNEWAIAAPKSDTRSQLAYCTYVAVGKTGFSQATISRISRRANCSPGAIYKIFPSKDELVIAAMRAVVKAPWTTTASFCAILDEGSLAQLLAGSASIHNDARKFFDLEVALASSSNVKLRAAVQSQLQSLEALVPFVAGPDQAEKAQLLYTIRLLNLLSTGTSFLSTLSPSVERMDFNQFAEPLRRSLEQKLPSWNEIRSQLLATIAPTDRLAPVRCHPKVKAAAF